MRNSLTALISIVACAGLGGCFSGNEPRLADGFGLFFQDEGSSAKLAYGLADSDDVALMLQCAKGSGQVQVTDVARDTARPVLVLASAEGASVLLASLQPNPEGQAPLLAAQTRADSPALAAFRDTGRISVRNGDFRYAITATSAERTSVDRFFAACGPARAMPGDRQV